MVAPTDWPQLRNTHRRTDKIPPKYRNVNKIIKITKYGYISTMVEPMFPETSVPGISVSTHASECDSTSSTPCYLSIYSFENDSQGVLK